MMSSLSPLYHIDKNGNVRVWKVFAIDDTIQTEYGVVDGKMQLASKVAEAKCVGTKAETTPAEQAIREAEAMWKHRVDRKYSTTLEDARLPSELPMLAHKYPEKLKYVTWPSDLQRKLDGLRCTARCENGEVTLYSRQGKVLNLPHICKELAGWMDDSTVLDGELYVHGVKLQTINSWIPKPGQSLKPESDEIQYHVYDVPGFSGKDGLVWKDRFNNLCGIMQTKHVRIVETFEVNSEDEAFALVKEFEAEGYEGGILRNHQGIYDWGHRSAHLLKMKKFEDDEFEVIGYKEGKGRYKGKVTWRCLNNDGTDNEFSVTPRGTMEEKAEWFENGDEYLGKLLTVRFFGRTKKNIPFLPVGIVFRIDEDLPNE